MEICANCQKAFKILKITAYPFGPDTIVWVCSKECKGQIESVYIPEKQKEVHK